MICNYQDISGKVTNQDLNDRFRELYTALCQITQGPEMTLKGSTAAGEASVSYGVNFSTPYARMQVVKDGVYTNISVLNGAVAVDGLFKVNGEIQTQEGMGGGKWRLGKDVLQPGTGADCFIEIAIDGVEYILPAKKKV